MPIPPEQRIFRIHHDADFTMIANSLLNDARVSFKAKGVLCFLLSKPTEWRTSRRHLMHVGRDGQASIASALQELAAAGYVSYEAERGPDGRLLGWAWHIYERPIPPEQCHLPPKHHQRLGKPTAGKSSGWKTHPL